MKYTQVVAAKIQPDIYKLIAAGEKKFELRNESFRSSGYIKYVDADTGAMLGMYELGSERRFDADDGIDFLAALASVDELTLRRLGLSVGYVFAAPIGKRVTAEDVLRSQEES